MVEADPELRRRAIESLPAEVAAFGSGAPGSRVIRRDGLVAAVTPSTPDRSLFNSVYYEDRDALAEALDELAATYGDAGVRAWTVFVPDDDRGTAELLASRGHALDAAPRAMGRWLADLAPSPPAPRGVHVASGDPATAGRLNDGAYGYQGAAFGAALTGTTQPSIRWAFAACEGELAACVGAIDVEEDCCITGVATPPAYQRRGIASWLLHRVLTDARARGLRTASLQATKQGAGIYERLGFRDLGFVEMWERRRRGSGARHAYRAASMGLLTVGFVAPGA